MNQLLNHPLIGSRYFFPGGRPPSSELTVPVNGAELACAIHRVDPDGFTVVHFHGNGEVVADWQGLWDRVINTLGWDLLLAEYRGYGGSSGEPLLGLMLDDVAAVIEAAGPPEKVVVMGRSVGSFFALEAVKLFPSIAGLILESAIADPLERLLLRVTPDEVNASADDWRMLEQRMDHQSKIGGYTGPTLLLHTRVDGLVDVSHAQRLERWAGGPTTLRIFESGNHNSILGENWDQYLADVAGFLERVRSSSTS